MRFRFIEDYRDVYPVRLMCAVLEVSPAGYYAWRGRPVSARASANATLLATIRQVHQDSGRRYGSPRVHASLRAQGRGVSRGRVERLMRRHGIRAIMAPPRRVRTTDSQHSLPIAPNLIECNFVAAAPNQVWLADITYIPTGEGWLYLAAVMDLFSRKIVGWAMRDHLRTELASSALVMAIQRQRPVAGLIHHSDRGVQYASYDYRAALSAARITASMTVSCQGTGLQDLSASQQSRAEDRDQCPGAVVLGEQIRRVVPRFAVRLLDAQFPSGNPSDTSNWHPVAAAQTIPELRPAEPMVLTFSWPS
jgi:putative transposase